MNRVDRLSLAGIACVLVACKAGGSESAAPVEHSWTAPEEAQASSPLVTEPEVLAVRAAPRTREHEQLEGLAGCYQVSGSFYPRPDARARAVEGTLRAEWNDASGQLESRFVGRLWDQPFEYSSDLGYDGDLGCWLETWHDEGGSVLRPLAQGFTDADGAIVSVRHEDGRPVRDELTLGADRILRRVWRTSAAGVEYLSLELSGLRSE